MLIRASNKLEATSSKFRPSTIVSPLYLSLFLSIHNTTDFRPCLELLSIKSLTLLNTFSSSPDTMKTSAFGE